MWPKLIGKPRKQPADGRWHEWKQVVADHCDGRCVYCAIPEGRFGGIRNFHIEHFRPKAKFPRLENDIRNLYLACAVCNVLKCDDWPAEPANDHSLAAYPDPSVTDYNTLLLVSQANYEVNAVTIAGRYLIERILLNRAQLILERRLSAMLDSLAEFETWINISVKYMTPSEMKATIKVLVEISQMKTGALKARPYNNSATKRPLRSTGAKKDSRS